MSKPITMAGVTGQSPVYQVPWAYISKAALVDLLADIAHGDDLDYRKWSIWEAELLELLAARIRTGYNSGYATAFVRPAIETAV
jgi:NAD(P)H-flavin reductase